MKWLSLTGALGILIFNGPHARAQSRGQANVVVEAWSAGGVISDAAVELVESGTQELIRKFQVGRAEGVPVGQYLVRVRRPGFKMYERTVDVPSGEVYIKVLLAVGNFPKGSAALKGSVDFGLRADSVRLIPVVDGSATIVDTRVSPGGQFLFREVERGDYIVVALRADEVQFVSTIRLIGDAQLVVGK